VTVGCIPAGRYPTGGPASSDHQLTRIEAELAYLFLRDNHNDPFDLFSFESYRMVSARYLEHQVVRNRHSSMRLLGLVLVLGIDSASSAVVVAVVASYTGSFPFVPFHPFDPFRPYPSRHYPSGNPFGEDSPSSIDCLDSPSSIDCLGKVVVRRKEYK
jgi:hypothetical protein